MKIRTGLRRFFTAALVLSMALELAACGGGAAKAASMRLSRTEGTVNVSDGDGASVDVVEKMGLFSGYQVATEAASYGWIDLDETKLTKLDETSEVEVRQDGRVLELVVGRGSLFFNVTKPLEEDETLTIRTSTMVTGIRGTQGWVRVESESRMYVYILDGTVECSVTDPETGEPVASESVSAGEMAVLSCGESGASVEKGQFTQADIPAFVSDEMKADKEPAGGGTEPSGSGPDIVPFAQRDQYVEFGSLPAELQASIRELADFVMEQDVASILYGGKNQLRNFELMGSFSSYTDYTVPEEACVENGVTGFFFFSELDGSRVMVGTHTGENESDSRLEIEIRPENGTAYYGGIGYWTVQLGQCPCENWQLNGTATIEQIEGEWDNAWVTNRITGAAEDGARAGVWTTEFVPETSTTGDHEPQQEDYSGKSGRPTVWGHSFVGSKSDGSELNYFVW